MPTRTVNGELVPVPADLAGQALWDLNNGTSIRYYPRILQGDQTPCSCV